MRCCPRRLATASPLCSLIAGLLGTGLAMAQARVDYPPDPGFLVVRYAQVHEGIGEEDNILSLSIFGDNRLEIHFPFYLRRAGDWDAQLDSAEVEALVLELVEDGLLEFDASEVGTDRDRAEEARRDREGTRIDVTDSARIEIELGLRSYTSPEGVTENDLQRRVTWRNLRPEARLYPEVVGLTGLVAAEDALLQLLERRDLVRRTGERKLTIED